MTRNILLDFDGTIGDTRQLIVRTLQDTMRERHLDVKNDEDCAGTIGLRLDEAFVALFGFSAEEGERCAATYRDIFERNKQQMVVQPFPHVVDTLRRLHAEGYTLSIASSRNRESLLGYVHQLGIDDCITCIVAGDSVAHAKPAPDMVLQVLSETGFTAGESLVVGDMLFDVDMAHNAGVRACAVTYGNATRQELASADYIIDDFAQLLDVVR